MTFPIDSDVVGIARARARARAVIRLRAAYVAVIKARALER